MVEEKIDIGRVVAPHGVKGEFRISPLTDFPDRFSSMETLRLYDDKGFRLELPISSVRIRPDKGDILVRSDKISDREGAESIRGLWVRIDKDERVPLPEGDFWVDDLIGMMVVDGGSGTVLGEICDVMVTGGADVYSVRRPDGRIFMVPAAANYVSSVDLEASLMVVKGVQELMDL